MTSTLSLGVGAVQCGPGGTLCASAQVAASALSPNVSELAAVVQYTRANESTPSTAQLLVWELPSLHLRTQCALPGSLTAELGGVQALRYSSSGATLHATTAPAEPSNHSQPFSSKVVQLVQPPAGSSSCAAQVVMSFALPHAKLPRNLFVDFVPDVLAPIVLESGTFPTLFVLPALNPKDDPSALLPWAPKTACLPLADWQHGLFTHTGRFYTEPASNLSTYAVSLNLNNGTTQFVTVPLTATTREPMCSSARNYTLGYVAMSYWNDVVVYNRTAYLSFVVDVLHDWTVIDVLNADKVIEQGAPPLPAVNGTGLLWASTFRAWASQP